MKLANKPKTTRTGRIFVDIEIAPLDLMDKGLIRYLIFKQTNTLNPIFSRIIVMGTAEPGKPPVQFYGENEKKILEDFWKEMAHRDPVKFITFNGYGFDIPFIYVRSRITKVRPTVKISTYKYGMEENNHFDCMLALSHYGIFPWVSLEVLCKAHGIPVPRDRETGEMIADLYEKRDWNTILEHNRVCLELTEKLYEKCCGSIIPSVKTTIYAPS
jgi:DNA polymerase elongation subunit (family B)